MASAASTSTSAPATRTDIQTMSLTDSVASFGKHLRDFMDLFAVTFPNCQPTQAAKAALVEKLRTPTEVEALVTLWFIRMNHHFKECSKYTDAAMEKIAGFIVFKDMEVATKYKNMGEERRALFWVLANSCNASAIFYDKSADDGCFKELTDVATRIGVLFKPEDLRQKSTADMLQILPQVMQDKELLALVRKIAISDERLDRALGIVELQYGTFEPAQRDIMRQALKNLAKVTENETVMNFIGTVANAAPSLLQATQTVWQQVTTANPQLGSMASSLFSLFKPNESVDPSLPTEEELAKALAALNSTQ